MGGAGSKHRLPIVHVRVLLSYGGEMHDLSCNNGIRKKSTTARRQVQESKVSLTYDNGRIVFESGSNL